ncbi:MAG: ribosome assembly cofactor RimP [Bacteroidales bacterium]|nr:ribosome assembly cofactor RimP [Bacteroidales bacterium]HPE99792.1 ribosome assembly cofactor RimP [Bacteroidales bacterium]
MIKENTIIDLARECCGDEKIFPVSVNIRQGNRILVLLDGDTGVTIHDCVRVSRFIENRLDREKEDFELEVSSFGVGNPLVLPRQYINNINRSAKVTLNDQSVITGTIVAANENSFTIAVKIPPKKKEIQNREIAYTDCLKTQIIVSFK